MLVFYFLSPGEVLFVSVLIVALSFFVKGLECPGVTLASTERGRGP